MQKDEKQEEAIPLEVQEVMRNLVSAIRAVKLYPPNNPVYSQSIRKSYETMERFLGTTPKYAIGVQKKFFTYLQTPFGKEGQLNKAVAQDLFAKGIREIVFSSGMNEGELLELYRAFALSPEELAMKSGISTILWEKGATHITITESGLDEVITAKTEGVAEKKHALDAPAGALEPSTAKRQIMLAGRTLVLGDLVTDPAGFGASMIQLAKQTCGERETVEDRLFSLYLEAGRHIQDEHDNQEDVLFQGLANSAVSLESPYREGLIAGKLYPNADSEIVIEQKSEFEELVPNYLQEILTGRFSDEWTGKQVAVLLKKAAAKKTAPSAPPPVSSAALRAEPIPGDILDIVKDFTEYTPEEMEALKDVGKAGMESDIIEAATRTLLFLLPLVRSSPQSAPSDKEVEFFSGVVHQLEDMVTYLLQKKDYDLATLIIRALHMPVAAAFKPRMEDAIKKTTSRSSITATISDMRNYAKGSPEYCSAYSYLSVLERESTETLIELLASENDRSTREFLLDILKEVGKNQISFIGEHISDERWYLVRNIVNILGETRADQALVFLQKVADHKNVQIRQEVIKGLVGIGGKKAAGLLAKFLNDKDADIRLLAIQSFAEISGIGAEEIKQLMAFLQRLPVRKKVQSLTLEAIKALGKIGDASAREFLTRYYRVRWWRPRQLQMELRAAALRAREEIRRREVDDGRTQRQPR